MDKFSLCKFSRLTQPHLLFGPPFLHPSLQMLTAIRTALRFGIGSLRLQLQSKPKPPAILDFEYAKNGLDKYLKLQLYKFSIPAGSYALIHQNKLVAHNNIGFFRPRYFSLKIFNLHTFSESDYQILRNKNSMKEN